MQSLMRQGAPWKVVVSAAFSDTCPENERSRVQRVAGPFHKGRDTRFLRDFGIPFG